MTPRRNRYWRNIGYISISVVVLVLLSVVENKIWDVVPKKSQVTTAPSELRRQGESTHLRKTASDDVEDSLLLESDVDLSSLISGCNGKAKVRKHSEVQRNLTRLTKLWAQNALSVASCPELIKIIADKNRTPRVMHRIWECETIPEHYFPSLHSWLESSTSMFHLLWTNALREKFIAKELGEHELKLYRRLVPGAYRADFFRYFIMFYVGGLYSDIDTFLSNRLTEIKDFDTVTTLVIDLDSSKLLNGVLIAPSENPLFLCAMGEVLDHSSRRHYPSPDATGGLDVSGPGVLGECVRHVTGRDELVFEPGKVDFGVFHFQLLKSLIVPNGGPHAVQLQDGSELLRLMPGGAQYEILNASIECDPGTHYSELYTQRKVYRENDEELDVSGEGREGF